MKSIRDIELYERTEKIVFPINLSCKVNKNILKVVASHVVSGEYDNQSHYVRSAIIVLDNLLKRKELLRLKSLNDAMDHSITEESVIKN